MTPGSFTGYGFDQCTAPTQQAMDAWLTSSPYWAVGIYISGDSRGCPSQPNLTPTWVGTQLAQRLAAAADHARPAGLVHHPRSATCTRSGSTPRSTGPTPPPAARAAPRPPRPSRAAQALGIAARQHAVVRHRGLRHLQDRLPRVGADASCPRGPSSCTPCGYVSGVYSSAASGIKMLDDARATRPGALRDARPALDRRLERPRRHLARATSAATAGCRTAGCTSTAAATTRPTAA